jgi:hypothetical protein
MNGAPDVIQYCSICAKTGPWLEKCDIADCKALICLNEDYDLSCYKAATQQVLCLKHQLQCYGNDALQKNKKTDLLKRKADHDSFSPTQQEMPESGASFALLMADPEAKREECIPKSFWNYCASMQSFLDRQHVDKKTLLFITHSQETENGLEFEVDKPGKQTISVEQLYSRLSVENKVIIIVACGISALKEQLIDLTSKDGINRQTMVLTAEKVDSQKIMKSLTRSIATYLTERVSLSMAFKLEWRCHQHSNIIIFDSKNRILQPTKYHPFPTSCPNLICEGRKMKNKGRDARFHLPVFICRNNFCRFTDRRPDLKKQRI